MADDAAEGQVGVEHGDDARVLQSRGSLRFVDEALDVVESLLHSVLVIVFPGTGCIDLLVEHDSGPEIQGFQLVAGLQ